jgi:hypothetical protein
VDLRPQSYCLVGSTVEAKHAVALMFKRTPQFRSFSCIPEDQIKYGHYVSRIFTELKLTFMEMIATSHFMLICWFDGLDFRIIDCLCGFDSILMMSNADI